MKQCILLLALFFCIACNKDAFIKAVPFTFLIPKHFPAVPQPAGNIATVQGVALGKILFYDVNLSKQNNISCASCHLPQNAFADSNKFSAGNNGLLSNRNTQALFNVAYTTHYFWDGGVPNLESTSLVPLLGVHEMANNLDYILNYLNANAQYTILFKNIYGIKKINSAMLLNVLAQFQRTFISANSKYDKIINGSETFTLLEKQGLALFNNPTKGNCSTCHALPLGTDNQFHNIGLDSVITDVGRYRITLNNVDSGKFRTPSIRNLSYTAPYMHDGRFKTLKEVLAFYNAGFSTTHLVDSNIINLPKNRLTTQELNAIEAFLLTLDDATFISNPAFAKP